MLNWLIIENFNLTCGILMVSVPIGIALLLFGFRKIGASLITLPILGILIAALIDLIILSCNHFWAMVLVTIFIASFFTKSGQVFWKYALIFGAVYKISESVFHRK